MPLAATHLISSVLVVRKLKELSTQVGISLSFPQKLIALAAFGGILPDIDMTYHVVAYMSGIVLPTWLQHGGIFHTPLFALLFLLLAILFVAVKKEKPAIVCSVLFVGILVHLLLDYVIGGGAEKGIMWFFPFSQQGWSINLLQMSGIPHAATILDGVVIVGWLMYVEWKVGFDTIVKG